MDDKTKRRTMSINEVAAELGVSKASAYEAARSGFLKEATINVGKRILVSAARFDKLVDAADTMTTACANCHEKYRDKPGGDAARCM